MDTLGAALIQLIATLGFCGCLFGVMYVADRIRRLLIGWRRAQRERDAEKLAEFERRLELRKIEEKQRAKFHQLALLERLYAMPPYTGRSGDAVAWDWEVE
jgi:hypothetical protein